MGVGEQATALRRIIARMPAENSYGPSLGVATIEVAIIPAQIRIRSLNLAL